MNFEPPEPNDYGHCLKCQKFVIEDEQQNGICIDCQSFGGAAFPQSGFDRWAPEGGMTLRDYFAAKIIVPLIGGSPGASFGSSHPETNLNYAKAAYSIADAMLEARK